MVVASGSVIIEETLNKLSLSFATHPVNIEYIHHETASDDAVDNAKRLAYEKAQKVAKEYPNCISLACHTDLYHYGNKISSPTTKDHALEAINGLIGKHCVAVTGICSIDSDTGEHDFKVYQEHVRINIIDDDEARSHASAIESGNHFWNNKRLFAKAVDVKSDDQVDPINEVAEMLRKFAKEFDGNVVQNRSNGKVSHDNLNGDLESDPDKRDESKFDSSIFTREHWSTNDYLSRHVSMLESTNQYKMLSESDVLRSTTFGADSDKNETKDNKMSREKSKKTHKKSHKIFGLIQKLMKFKNRKTKSKEKPVKDRKSIGEVVGGFVSFLYGIVSLVFSQDIVVRFILVLLAGVLVFGFIFSSVGIALRP